MNRLDIQDIKGFWYRNSVGEVFILPRNANGQIRFFYIDEPNSETIQITLPSLDKFHRDGILPSPHYCSLLGIEAILEEDREFDIDEYREYKGEANGTA